MKQLLVATLFVCVMALPAIFVSFASAQEGKGTANTWIEKRTDEDRADKNATAKEIESILSLQAECWNQKNLEGFMQTYWKSPKLSFSSGGKTTRGWQATFDRYRKGYKPETMGNLNFDHLEVTVLSKDSALILGQWHLKIDEKKRDGNFTLVVRKFEDDWKIIHDHSSEIKTEDEN